jgi:hypothetical protein
MVSQPIRLILVDWLYPKDFLSRVRLFQVRFFFIFMETKNNLYGTPILFIFLIAPQSVLFLRISSSWVK